MNFSPYEFECWGRAVSLPLRIGPSRHLLSSEAGIASQLIFGDGFYNRFDYDGGDTFSPPAF